MTITKRALATFALVLLGTGGCGVPAWTEAVRARYSLTSDEVRRVQFFTSGEIVLRREVGVQGKVESDGQLQIRDDVRIEEIVIPARTPCVALRVEPGYILASFSKTHPDQALWFGLKSESASQPPESRRYELVPLANPIAPATSGGRREAFKPEVSKGFLLHYAGQKYRLADGRAWSVHLLYELDEEFDKDRVREKPEGWRVREGVRAPAVSVPQSAKPAPAPPASSSDAGPAPVDLPNLPDPDAGEP